MKTVIITLLAVSAWGQAPLPGPFVGSGGSGGGGGGGVTSITTSCGIAGGTITTTGNINRAETVDSQTGAGPFAIPNSDCGGLVFRNQSGAVSDTIAQAGSGGGFGSGWLVDYQCAGAGGCTITPATSTIDGASSLALTQNQGVRIVSNGTNYFTQRGVGGGGGAPSGPAGGVLSGTYPNPGLATSVAIPGSPTTTTQAASDSSTKVATTAYVQASQDCKLASSLGFAMAGADETTLFNTTMTAFAAAGGGCLKIDAGKAIRLDGQIVIPQNGANSYLAPIRITGYGENWGWSPNLPAALKYVNALDLRYAGTGGTFDSATYGYLSSKIEVLYPGKFEIDHINLVDQGSDCTTFVVTTLGMTSLHDIAILGTSHTTPCNIATVWGGTRDAALSPTFTPFDYYSGYNGGTGMHHFQCRDTATCAFLGSSANGLTFEDGISQGGMSTGNRAHFEVDGFATPANANTFRDIILQMDRVSGNDATKFLYGIYFNHATYNFAGPGLSCWDGAGGSQACILVSSNASHNTTYPFMTDGTVGDYGGGGANNNNAVVGQTFYGTGAPGSVIGNRAGDKYVDNTNHKRYWCAADSQTSAPACTGVSATGWVEFQSALTNPITGSLTSTKLPKATGATTLGDSNLTENADGSDNAGKALTWASATKPTFNSGGTTTCDLSLSNLCEVDFGAGNTTLAFSNPHGSGPYWLRSCQDTVGARIYTFAGTMKGFVQPDPAAGTTNCTEQPFTYDGTNYQGNAGAVPTSAWHGVSAAAVAFSNLPTCSSVRDGTYATVSDSSTATLGATVTGSGSNHVLAYCNGTNWVVGAGATGVAISSGVSGLGTGVATFLATPSGANFNSMIAAGGVPIAQGSHSAAYTTVLADGGTQLLHPTADNNARTFTIDSNANVAYPIGTTITFVNQINTLTIAITSDTLQLAGTATTGSRTLAVGGIATAVKITSTLWFISGPGLT